MVMPEDQLPDWTKKLVTPERVLEEVKPGMSIFLGTGAAEPRTLVRHLIASPLENLKDLELLQLISLSDAVTSHKRSPAGRFRLKTFFSGWLASDAVTSGSIDLIPSRISRIPRLLESGAIRVDAAFVQITPPDASGYASLGVSVDAAKYAMEKATLVVG
jgi:acyl-CoA hydrolase